MSKCSATNAFRVINERRDNGEREHPCFRIGPANDLGRCQADGWFRCSECIELAPKAREYLFGEGEDHRG